MIHNFELSRDGGRIGTRRSVGAVPLAGRRGASVLSRVDIFISYNHADVERARQFAKALEKSGFSVWWDATLRSGEAYDQVTEDALENARAVVVLWSPRSVGSRWVRAEATEAERSGKLVPAMIDPCKRPIMFELVHTAELSHWRGDRTDPAWQTFVSDLGKLVGKEADLPPVAISEVAAAEPVAEAPADTTPRRFVPWILGAIALLVAAAVAYHFNSGGEAPKAQVSEERLGSVPLLVRPFTASGTGDKTESAMAGGITDELIVRLRRIPELRVGTVEPGTTGAGKAFAGAYVVDGNIRSMGDRLRVTARLSDAKGQILWSDTFDREVSELFDLQETIAGKIASALSVSLDVGSDSKAYGGTNSPEAYAAFLQYKATEYAIDQSIPLGYLQRAISLDPDYLKALGAMAASYNPRMIYSSSRQEADKLFAEMDKSTQHMLATNPNMWMGHVARAWYFVVARDPANAALEVQKASDLDAQMDPSLPAELATISYCLGQAKRAAAFAKAAQLIDPMYRTDPRVIRDDVFSGEYQDAIARYDKLVADGNDARMNHTIEATWAYLMLGREQDALTFSDKYGGGALAGVMAIFKDGNDLPPADLPAMRKWADAKYGGVGQFELANGALFASFYGRTDMAVNMLRLAFDRPGGYAIFAMWYPAMAKARATPAFSKLMADLGFVKAWQSSGQWPDFCRPGPEEGVVCS